MRTARVLPTITASFTVVVLLGWGFGPAHMRPRGGLTDKRRAILAGALVRFARDGYVRAGMDAIAAEAGVSTRTIYNHFRSEAELFAAVIEDSAAGVADAEIALVDRDLGKIVDLPGDLFEFGVARSRPLTGFADHFALVR